MGRLRRTALAAALLLLGAASEARAAERCSVAIDGVASAAWAAAREELSTMEFDGDCARVVVRMQRAGADLVVETRDGRRVERALREPDELVPTAKALLITTDVAAAEEPVRPVVIVVARDPDASPSVDRAVTPKAPPASRVAAILGLQGGVRAGADDLSSGIVNAALSLGIDRWEVGVMAGMEHGYHSESGINLQGPAGRSSFASSWGAGVLFGRRQPAGPFELVGGGRAAVALVSGHAEINGPRRRNLVELQSEPELRVGAYGGVVFPRRSSIRLRSELALDAAPSQAGAIALTPPWMASLQFGVELAR